VYVPSTRYVSECLPHLAQAGRLSISVVIDPCSFRLLMVAGAVLVDHLLAVCLCLRQYQGWCVCLSTGNKKAPPCSYGET
jgi:hypothetical protein